MRPEKWAAVAGAFTNLAIRWGIHRFDPTNSRTFETITNAVASTVSTSVAKTINNSTLHRTEAPAHFSTGRQESVERTRFEPAYYQVHPIQINGTVSGYLASISNTEAYPTALKQVFPEWFSSPHIAVEWIKSTQKIEPIAIEVISPATKHPLTMAAQTVWLAHHQQKPVESWDMPKSPWMIAPISEDQHGKLLGYAAWHYRLTSRGTEVAVLTEDRQWSTTNPPQIFSSPEDVAQEIDRSPFADIPKLTHLPIVCPHQLFEQLRITLSPEQRSWLIARRAPSSFVPVPCDPILQQSDSIVPMPQLAQLPDTHPRWYLAPIDPQKPEGITCAWHFDEKFPKQFIEIAGVMNRRDQWELVTWNSYESACRWMRRIGEWTQPHPRGIPNPKLIRTLALHATVVPKTPMQQFPVL